MPNDYIIIIWSPLTVFLFFFLYVLISLIKLSLCLEFFTDRRQAEDVRGRTIGTYSVSPSHT